jgi:hypothetical protein
LLDRYRLALYDLYTTTVFVVKEIALDEKDSQEMEDLSSVCSKGCGCGGIVVNVKEGV